MTVNAPVSTASLVLAAAAITIVFVRSSIFKRVREGGPALWQELAACPLCAGVWIGAGWRVTLAFALERATRPEPPELALQALAVGAMTGVLALGCQLLLAVLDKHS